jgi:hypothetical protein
VSVACDQAVDVLTVVVMLVQVVYVWLVVLVKTSVGLSLLCVAEQ